MHGKQMKYMLVAAGALAVGFLMAGTPIQSLLPVVLLLACPLMMIFMMRGMGGHGGHGGHAGCGYDGHAGHDGQAGHAGHGGSDGTHRKDAPSAEQHKTVAGG